MPLFTSAGTKAVAPGKHSTLIPSFMHSRTSKKAGSEIPGVPASVMSAKVFPLLTDPPNAQLFCVRCADDRAITVLYLIMLK